MKDISSKKVTLRTAKACGVIYCSPLTIELVRSNNLPKGNLFDVARAAAFLGAKLTPQLLPHCHPVQIDAMDIQFDFLDQEIHGQFISDTILKRNGIFISGTAKSIGRTGIEMELLTAISIAGLEIYDMLKPIDKELEIGNIKLINKKGGKSDFHKPTKSNLTAAILVCSDSVAGGLKEDSSGVLAEHLLKSSNVNVVDYKIVADNEQQIKDQITKWVDEDIHFIITVGGTGLGPKDVTVEAVSEILQYQINSIAEAMRIYGLQRTPYAMMSRGIAGKIKNSIIITLPGSINGVEDGLNAILPQVLHGRDIIMGGGHDKNQ